MNRKDLIDRLQELYKDEDSRITVNPHAGQKVAIVYPNTYFVGMSNLGLHIIYEESTYVMIVYVNASSCLRKKN